MTREPGAEGEILAVREGHGANCSSVGSAVDLLYGAATAGALVFAAIAAALAAEPVKVVGETEAPRKDDTSPPQEGQR